MRGVDIAWGILPGHERDLARTLRRQGFGFVVRYLSHDGSKNITRAEADAYRAEGLQVATVWEDSAQAALGGASAGNSAARAARAQLDAIGAPAHAPVFFAVDFEVSPGQMSAVDEYLDATALVLSEAQNGVYGDYAVVSRAKHVKYRWQTLAWSGGRWDPGSALRQVSINSGATNGVAWDLDEASAADFGQWRYPPGGHHIHHVPKPRRHRVRKIAGGVKHLPGNTKKVIRKEPVLTAGTLAGLLSAVTFLVRHRLGLHLTPDQVKIVITALTAAAGAAATAFSRPVRVGAVATVLSTASVAAAAFMTHLPVSWLAGQMPLAALAVALGWRIHVSPVASQAPAAAPVTSQPAGS